MQKSKTPKLTRAEMIQFIKNITHPVGFTSEEINHQLLCICATCPDPAAAMDLVLECGAPITAEELVDRALLCRPRNVTRLPDSELAAARPLRRMNPDP